MFSRARYAAITFGIALLCSSASFGQPSPEEAEPNQAESQRQNGDGDQSSAPYSVPVRILEEPEESEDAKRQQEKAAEREVNDLAAQESMAESTQQIVWLTALQFLLATVGTAALIYTILLNRKATFAAVEAAGAARDAIGMERAWVTYGQWEIMTVKDSVIDDKFIKDGLGFSLHWLNTGRSPALKLFSRFKFVVIGAEEEIPRFEFRTPSNERGSAAVGPQGSFATGWLHLNDEQTERFKDPDNRMIMYACVWYADVFHPNVQRLTEMTFACYYHGMKTDRDGQQSHHITFAPMGPQNSAT